MPESAPVITYPADLPVSVRVDDIREAIEHNQVVIVAGATGSGKTTQLPKICLDMGRTAIGHTQPRRIAARTIAERIAEETGTDLGDLVGYQVRFSDRVSEQTRVKVMTDGILLAEIHRDRLLKKYDTIIIDEAHERSLTIDFLLGYLKRILPDRPDLRVIITSATIDPQSFSEHFGGAPIIEVSGRTFPVDIRYRPLVDEVDDETEKASEPRDLFTGIADALAELEREEPGDVLVFLSGEGEIRDAAEALRGRAGRTRGGETEILPLYGRLTNQEQRRVFEKRPQGVTRRIVLTTNVAETSLTVPGIRYVIDAGTARISRYSTRAKVQRLPIEAISQASAAQRSGRAGRTSPGIAIRLYSDDDFAKRPAFTEPEILRTNLAAVILQMISLGLGEIEDFPFLQPPDRKGVTDGIQLLKELGAVSVSGGSPRVTKIGRQLARIPIDPRYARMIIEAGHHDCVYEVIVIVASLSVQDVRERPANRRERADSLHARFTDPTSDFISMLLLWRYLREKEHDLSSSAFRRLCRDEHINFLRYREWRDLVRQLSRSAGDLHLRAKEDLHTEPGAKADAVHRSILAGLVTQIGVRDREKRDYLGARGTRFVIFPGSALAKKQPDAVMAAELVETSRLFARQVAAIDLRWVESLAKGLTSSTVSEPHWERRQGAAVASERVTLLGVPIIPRRRVQYARIDPVHAREIFIRSALVEGDWNARHAFDRANRKLRDEIEQLEERTRRRDILFDDEAVFEFYDARIPADVTTQPLFEKWWQAERERTPKLLTMTRADLLPEDAESTDTAEYPVRMSLGDQQLSLSYRFEPGALDDGVTTTIPLELLPRVSETGPDRLVPGLRGELITALIRSLPKAIRKRVVPAADWAARIEKELTPAELASDVPFPDLVAAAIQRLVHERVTADDFRLDTLPPHLRMGYRVVDAKGKKLGEAKDLASLQKRFAKASQKQVATVTARAGAHLEKTGLTAWPGDEIALQVETKVGTGRVRAYPALVDRGSSVDLVLATSPDEQSATHARAVARLVVLGSPSTTSYVQEHLTNAEKLTLAASPYSSTSALLSDIELAIADSLVAASPDVRSRDAFDAVASQFSAIRIDESIRVTALIVRVLDAARSARAAIKKASSLALMAPLADVSAQLDALVFPGFIRATGAARLADLARYADAARERVERLQAAPNREAAAVREFQAAFAEFERAGGTTPLPDGAPQHLGRARWMLEELRVRLFAPTMRTAETVSLQRIRAVLERRG